ncbi:MAG: tRNA dihydrouridine synthase DusB [Ignavibacterium sp.]|nr:tRNA dihydrouridine synthase DusB [Ignavibacterium sp.]MDW8376072.1 tRNA dihydrouridine synthase DusB [Ignavibacteriales bacterium]
MFKVGKISIEKALLLAPMEDVTDLSFRLVCKELGADVVYTEFVNSEGLVRGSEKTHKKLKISDEERPVGIQIYGGELNSMIEAAKIAESENPDIIDINAGCWVKKVVGCGAGSALIKNPPYLQTLVGEIVKAVKIPVTVKTRIGWDENDMRIVEIAERLQDVGVAALTIHCRTRKMGHRGDPDWSWINKVKEKVSIPIVLNGGVFTAEDAKRAFDETNADAVMIARGAIGNPWIFSEAKELISNGLITTQIDEDKRIKTALRHLQIAIEIKGERRAVIEHRKFYSGYLKGLHHSSRIRNELMNYTDYASVENCLMKYLEELKFHNYLKSLI